MNLSALNELRSPAALFKSFLGKPPQSVGSLNGNSTPLQATPSFNNDNFSGVSKLLARRGLLPAPATLLPTSPLPTTPPKPAHKPQAQLPAIGPTPQSLTMPNVTFDLGPNVSPLAPKLSPIPIPRPRPATPSPQSSSPLAPTTVPIPKPRPQNLRPLPDTSASESTQKVTGSKHRPLSDTFTYQFGEIGKHGSRMEAQGNCGPAVASMLIKHFGVQAPTMRQLRRRVGAPTGTKRRAYAITTEQIGKAVQRTLNDKGIKVDFNVHSLSTNVDRALAKMRTALEAGEKVVLLSSGLSGLSRGHYMLVKEVRSDGSIVIDDPGKRRGRDNVYSKRRLSQALNARVNKYGRQNNLITVKEK